MGFFSNIFKKKKGGTFFGNLVRGVASTATGGVLGSGKELAEWQAKEEKKEYETVLAQNQALIEQSAGFQNGVELAKGSQGAMDNVLGNNPYAKQVQNNQVKAWLTRNWWAIAIPVVAIVVLIIMLVKKK